MLDLSWPNQSSNFAEMAEISEAPETSKDASDLPAKNKSEAASKISKPLPDFDPNTMRKTKPGLKRLILSVSVLLSFLFGLPILLKSIEIYRAPLPFRDIDSLSNAVESTPLLFPCRFQAVFVGFDRKDSTDWSSDKLGFSILGHMRKFAGDDQVCGTCDNNYTVSVTVDFGTDCACSKGSEPACWWRCGAMSELRLGDEFKDDDEFVDEYLESALGVGEGGLVNGGNAYTVVVVNRDQEVRAVVGKHRHAWIVGRVSEVDAVEKIAEIFVKMFVNGGKEEGLIHGEFMPVGADGKVVLSFNLLNADPDDWIYDWYGALVSLSYLHGASGCANN